MPKRVQMDATILPAGRRMAISSANCRVAGILSYLEPAKAGAAALLRWICGEMEDARQQARRNPPRSIPSRRMVRMVAACRRASSDCTALAASSRRFLRLLGGLVADAQAHQQLAKLQPGDEAIRSLMRQLRAIPPSLPAPADRRRAPCPAARGSRVRGRQFNGVAKLRRSDRRAPRLQHAGIAEHAQQLVLKPLRARQRDLRQRRRSAAAHAMSE